MNYLGPIHQVLKPKVSTVQDNAACGQKPRFEVCMVVGMVYVV